MQKLKANPGAPRPCAHSTRISIMSGLWGHTSEYRAFLEWVAPSSSFAELVRFSRSRALSRVQRAKHGKHVDYAANPYFLRANTPALSLKVRHAVRAATNRSRSSRTTTGAPAYRGLSPWEPREKGGFPTNHLVGTSFNEAAERACFRAWLTLTVLACGPFSPASSVNFTSVPMRSCGKCPSSTLASWK